MRYEQIKGTGLANTCPRVESPSESASISVGGGYKLKNFCLEPTSFQVLFQLLAFSRVDGLSISSLWNCIQKMQLKIQDAMKTCGPLSIAAVIFQTLSEGGGVAFGDATADIQHRRGKTDGGVRCSRKG